MKVMLKRRKVFWITIVVIVAIISAVVVLLYMQYDREYSRVQELFLKQHELTERENEFKTRPNLENCLFLFKYFYSYSDLSPEKRTKAVYYATRCVELGSDDTAFGWFVHLALSRMYKLSGDSLLALENLRTALRLDLQGTIMKQQLVDSFGLLDIYTELQKTQPKE
jgi:hypothetical protein